MSFHGDEYYSPKAHTTTFLMLGGISIPLLVEMVRLRRWRCIGRPILQCMVNGEFVLSFVLFKMMYYLYIFATSEGSPYETNFSTKISDSSQLLFL